jgi:hypothetical protein
VLATESPLTVEIIECAEPVAAPSVLPPIEGRGAGGQAMRRSGGA